MPEVNTASVLVVDDYPANLFALDALLSPLGHRVVTASSGEEALQRIAEEPFAVVLLDVQMPLLDGYATARLIRAHERSRQTPIIFVTASEGQQEQVLRGYAAGGIDYLVKPLQPEIVRAKVAMFATLYLQGEQLKATAAELRARDRVALHAEAARAAAESATRAKDEFLAMVSHELRTPLNAILGWAEMIRGGKLPSERVHQGVETIIRNARLQSQLVGDLLDISRIVAGKFSIQPQPTRLDAAVLSAVESIRPEAVKAGIELESTASGDTEELRIDPQRIQQVVCNLIGNAIKFTPKGGRISVAVERVADGFEIRVADSGRGIAAHFLPHVFDRFKQASSAATREHGGLGLGLAIVRHIVECHGGSVSVHSDGDGRGATFTVRLPLAANVPVAVPSEASTKITGEWRAIDEDEAVQLTGMRVLVVDDEPDSRELLAAMLTAAGAEVVAAHSVDEALSIVSAARFDAVVSDLAMPRRDGFELARALRSSGFSAPLIAISALSSNEDKARALESGFISHVSKPFEPTVLIALVGRLARGGDRRRRRRHPHD